MFTAFTSRQLRSPPTNLGHNFHTHTIRQLAPSSHIFSTKQPILFLPSNASNHHLIRLYSSSDNQPESRNSVTGTIYPASESESEDDIQIQLFTKEGCTLCDKVTDILKSIRSTHPHTLQAIDITDPEHKDYYDKYKYDIPILHIHGNYWIKHRLTKEEAIQGIEEMIQQKEKEGVWKFESRKAGEPDAGAMEQRQMERETKNEE